MEPATPLSTVYTLLVLLFWMVSLCQVIMSHLIHWRARSRKSDSRSSMAASQRKDDILASLLMGTALVSHHTGLVELAYLVGTFAMVWLSRRTRTRLDLLKPVK